MKHSKQNKRAPQTHASALAVPSYHRILVKHGLLEKTLSLPDAYEVFLKVGADPEVQKLRRKVERGNKMKHVPALYLATAMRSEERRVGKECKSRWSSYDQKKNDHYLIYHRDAAES